MNHGVLIAALGAPSAKFAVAERSYAAKKSKIDYTPKPIKLMQNISVMYEMK